ncbi:zf-TFIIB domain-containing protein [Shewanella sp. ENK2]|uniref:TFIIB-type zinc ribbon-containing protein n=1 Tax=Shewanella sp. ENK2 TaxID=2775245 RepID=UPI00374A1E09
MKCPRTASELTPIKVGGIMVEFSKASGGVFFDNYELIHFDEEHEKRGSVLVEHLSQFTPSAIDYSQRINCPKCPDIVMRRYFYSPKNQVEVDECPGCGGIWFDYNELAKIRELFPNQQDRDKAGKDFVLAMLETNIQKSHDMKIQQKDALAQKLQRLFMSVF